MHGGNWWVHCTIGGCEKSTRLCFVQCRYTTSTLFVFMGDRSWQDTLVGALTVHNWAEMAAFAEQAGSVCLS